MEESFKRDVLQEVRKGEGRILLHDEVEERPGVFSIIPIWEQVSEEDIMTPRNVFELMVKEGYHVSHLKNSRNTLLRASDVSRLTMIESRWSVFVITNHSCLL